MINQTSSPFVVIGKDPNSSSFFVQERENNNGQIGKVTLFADGETNNLNEVVDNYIKQGYSPDHIIANGKLASDVFKKAQSEGKEISFEGKVEYSKNNPTVKQVVTLADDSKVYVPVMLGCEFNVEALPEEKYKVTTQGVVYPKPEPTVEILTGEELKEKFDKYAPKLDLTV